MSRKRGRPPYPESKRREVKRLRQEGYSYREIARKTGVSKPTALNICRQNPVNNSGNPVNNSE